MPYNPGTQLKKAQIRALPKSISDYVLSLQSRYSTRHCKLYIENPGWELYLDEGATYNFYYGDKESSLQMMSESTFHAGGIKESYQIGRRVEIPQGGWVVGFELFLGKPIINVHHVGNYQLPA